MPLRKGVWFLPENEAKIINPDKKTLIRYYKDEEMYADGIALDDEEPESIGILRDPNNHKDDIDVSGLTKEILQGHVMDDGVSRIDRRSVNDIAGYVRKKLAALPERFKALRNGPDFPVGVSRSLMELRSRLIREAKNTYRKRQ